MKEKIVQLIKDMHVDSKSKSYEAEKELCEILTKIVNKKEAFEESCGAFINVYPESIYSIDKDGLGYYRNVEELPKYIYCNDRDFRFELSWLDINYEAYFEELKLKKLASIKTTIQNVERTLKDNYEKLEHIQNLKFEDIKID